MYSYYYNTASISPMMPPVREALDTFLDRYMLPDFAYYPFLQEQTVSIKDQLASYHQVTPDCIALFPNSASAFSMVMMGFPFKTGDHIIVVDHEFPSVSLPFSSLRKDLGLEITVLDQLSFYADPFTVLSDAIRPQTRCVLSSFVGYMSGVAIPLDRISTLCAQQDVFFFVDGTQGVGVLPVNCSMASPDVLVVSTYKWLQAPLGVSYAVISPLIRDLLTPSTSGWLSVENPTEMKSFDAAPSSTASAFEPGGRALLSTVGLNASLTHLSSLGFDTISRQTQALVSRFLEGLIALGIDIDLSFQRAGIISFPLAEKYVGLDHYLKEKGIKLTSRLGLIRFSIYYFHSEQDIDQLLGFISDFFNQT